MPFSYLFRENDYNVSVDFNGTTEELHLQTDAALGFADTWSVSIWLKSRTVTGTRRIVQMRDLGVENIVVIQTQTLTIPDPDEDGINVRISGPLTGDDKSYFYKDAIAVDTWAHLVATWTGNDSLLLYIDGTLTARTSSTADDNFNMTDTIGGLGYGIDVNGTSNHYDGLLGPWGIWNVVLDQASITAIFDGKFGIDLLANAGNYDQSSGLKHYFKPERDRVPFEDKKGSLDLIQFSRSPEDLELHPEDLVPDFPT